MKDLSIGSKIGFTYLKGVDTDGFGSRKKVDYSGRAANYQGEVVDVRDIDRHPLTESTYDYGKITGERSQNLITVELEDGDCKAFYDGRMVNRKVVNPTT